MVELSVEPARAHSGIGGIVAPVVTPFKTDYSPDAERLVRHCRWLLTNNVGLALFGTNSEANSLSVEERMDLLETLVEAGLAPLRMLPGTGCCALPDTVRLTAHAVKLGCAGALMLPPFYYKGVSDDGLYRSYAEVIERVGDARLRVYLYHFPQMAQVGISLALIERLLKAYPKTVVGMKDSSGDWNNTKAVLDAFAGDGFQMFPGNESYLIDALRAGAVGCITASANVNPAALDRLYREWRNTDAAGQQHGVNALRAAFGGYVMIPALKAAIAHYAGDAAWATVRPPLVELTAPQRSLLLQALHKLNFTMPGLTDA